MDKAIINGSFFKNNITNKIDVLVDSKLKEEDKNKRKRSIKEK